MSVFEAKQENILASFISKHDRIYVSWIRQQQIYNKININYKSKKLYLSDYKKLDYFFGTRDLFNISYSREL